MMDFGYIVTAMITPFTQQGDVHYDEAEKIAHHLVDTGTDTVLLAGTTGESPTLTHDEEYQLFKRVKQSLGNKALVMAGTGSNSTQTAIQSSLKAQDSGVDALLQVVPYYNKPTQEGCYQHFAAVANRTPLPIMLYNIPSRTGTNLDPETVARCAQIPTICSIKEAAGSIEQMKQLKRLVPDSMSIYSGDDALTAAFVNEGAVGVVSVAAHCAGRLIKDMITALHNNNSDHAKKIETQLKPLMDVLFISTNPTPVKAAMQELGFSVGKPRLPLIDVTDEQRQTIKDVLNQLQNTG